MNSYLKDILSKYNINIVSKGTVRNSVDVLEDLYLKINGDEWNKIVEEIAKTESIEGPIFDQARDRLYKP